MLAPSCSTSVSARQSSIYPAAFLVAPANLLIENCCAAAISLTASLVGGDMRYLIGLTCRRWSCRWCAAVKIKRLSWLCSRAKPNRLLTLTVNNSLYANPREAFDATRAFVPELIRSLRKRFGEIEYLRVTEVTAKGFPHYHLLVRSGYLPHAVVKSLWESYTGATIVDLRPVTNSFGAYNYLTKYLTKLHKIDWTERHVSYSKRFFPDDPAAAYSGPEMGDFQRINEHPFSWLANHCNGLTLVQEAPLRWQLKECSASFPTARPDGF